MNLSKKIQENIFHNQLLKRGSKIIVAVSGGPDSVCLLDILNSLKEKYDLELVIAHVNYGLRGKDSALDEKFVRELAEKYSLSFEIKQVTKSKTQAAKSEDILRKIRYDFFEKTRKKHNADLIAVGHNLNDQSETVLFRVIRGTGLRGLAAMKEKKGKIIRPLLDVPRKEISNYLKERKLKCRIDKTNLETDYARNKLRNILIPHIEKKHNPRFQEALLRLAETSALDHDYLSDSAKTWLAKHQKFSVKKFMRLHLALQTEVLCQLLEDRGSNIEIDFGHRREILKILKSNKNKCQIMHLGGLKIERRGDSLKLLKILSK